MKIFKSYFKRTETIIGLGAALIFQLVFIIVWLTAYDGVTNRTHSLEIGIATEDPQGIKISEKIKEKVDAVNIVTVGSFEKAQEDMNNHKLDMVVHIPDNFSQDLKSNNQPEISYYINQSRSMLSVRVMEKIANNIGTEINSQVFTSQKEAFNASIQQAVPSQNEQSKAIINQILPRVTEIVTKINNEPVMNKIVQANGVRNFSFTMVPLMIVLASFVGAMVMSMQLQQSAKHIHQNHNPLGSFFTRQAINVLMSIFLSLVTVSFLTIFNVELNTTFMETWGFQALTFFSFLCFSQLFVILFGNSGMLFNIIALSLQLVTCGVIVPLNMLPDFFQSVGEYLPATYVANGYYTIVYGSGELSSDVYWLLGIACMTLLFSLAKTLLFSKYNKVARDVDVV